MDRRGYIDTYFNTVGELTRRVSRDAIGRAVELLFDAWRHDATVFVMGNGGSASTASHFAADLAKGTIVPAKKRMKVMNLTDNVPLVSAWVNDSGPGSVFVEQLEPWLQQDDVLVGFSVHGGSGQGEAGPWSQNLVRAIHLAKKRRAKVIGFVGFGGGDMSVLADVCVLVPISEEPLGTPLVESLHVVIHHLICSELKRRIASMTDA